MPVLSCTIPARSEGRISMVALLHGVEADKIDSEDGIIYVDFIGSEDKINLVALDDEVKIIEQIDSVPHDEPVYTMVGRSFH